MQNRLARAAQAASPAEHIGRANIACNTSGFDRRRFAKEFTRRSRADVSAVLEQPLLQGNGNGALIAFTGPPGSGKSTIIAELGVRRVQAGRRVAVIAIDPSSPLSGGSILGDRIRMDALAVHPCAMVRSVSTGGATDGLCPNIVGLINLARDTGFDDIIVETVGVGQSTFAARNAVHTLVLVLPPESGDTVQAIKAGILELADIFIVHKSDLVGAPRLLQDIRNIVEMRRFKPGDWKSPVLSISSLNGTVGYDEMDDALTRHAAWRQCNELPEAFEERMFELHLRQLLAQAVENVLARRSHELGQSRIKDAFQTILHDLTTKYG